MSLNELLAEGSLWTDDVFEGRGKILRVEDGYVVWGRPNISTLTKTQQFLKEFTRVR